MKKILAIFLALVMILSVALVACSKDKATTSGDGDGGDDDDDVFMAQNSKDNKDSDEESDKVTNGEWTSLTNTTVYAMCTLRLRTEDSKSATVAKTVEAMTALSAVAKSDSWYKVNYEGQDLYVMADYVGLSLAEATFTNLPEDERFNVTVKAHEGNNNPYEINLRQLPTFDTEVTKTSVKKTDTDTNPMIVYAKNGTGTWYYVSYKGSMYYLAITSKTKPYLDGIATGDGNGNIVGG